jgi:hypothetical protein
MAPPPAPATPPIKVPFSRVVSGAPLHPATNMAAPRAAAIIALRMMKSSIACGKPLSYLPKAWLFFRIFTWSN